VAAHLDTGSYPLGVSVSAARMRTVAITAHSWCGAWNYTIDPATPDPADQQAGAPDLPVARARALELLADPALTGMPRSQLDELLTQLAFARAAQTAQRRYHQRGGRRRNAPGAGVRPLLTDTDRVVLTLVYLRQHCSQKVLSELLEINPHSIGEAIADTRQLFDEYGHTISPTTVRLATVAALARFLATGASPTTRPSVPALLSDPSLTGMPRPQLTALIKRLSIHQAAQAERRLHHRRGGERLPGARGGVFFEKITDAERVLITLLYQRQVCTRKVLAELFDITPTTIDIACRRVAPAARTRRLHPDTSPNAIHHRRCPARLREATQPHHGPSPTTVLIIYDTQDTTSGSYPPSAAPPAPAAAGARSDAVAAPRTSPRADHGPRSKPPYQINERQTRKQHLNFLQLPGEVNFRIARSRARVGWWEFSARLFRYFDRWCSTPGISRRWATP